MGVEDPAEEIFIPGSTGFEFSPSAPSFTPMGGPYTSLQSLRQMAQPFVPGALQEGDMMVLPNGTMGHVVGPPVLMPVNAVTPMMADGEFFDEEDYELNGEYDDRPQPRPRQA